jgi:hypothetical protein
MAWPTGDPVVEIDGLIARHRDDQIAWEHQLEEAVTAERQALGAMQAAQDLQERAKQAIQLDDTEIDRLLEERQVYVPKQRQPE